MNTDSRAKGDWLGVGLRHQTVTLRALALQPNCACLICVHRCLSVVSIEWIRLSGRTDAENRIVLASPPRSLRAHIKARQRLVVAQIKPTVGNDRVRPGIALSLRHEPEPAFGFETGRRWV